jgi:hypothetical protein
MYLYPPMHLCVEKTMYPMPTYVSMCRKNYVYYAHLCTYVSKKLCIYAHLCTYVSKKLCIYAHLCIYVSKKLCILCQPMHLCVEKKHRQHRHSNLCFYVNLCTYVSKKSIGSIDTPTYVSMPTYASMCRKNYVYYANLCI